MKERKKKRTEGERGKQKVVGRRDGDKERRKRRG